MKLARDFIAHYEMKIYSQDSWFISKIMWALGFFSIYLILLNNVSNINTPLSVCTFLPCSFFIIPEVKIIIYGLLFLLCILYVFEIKMKWVLFLLSCLSILIGSISDSSGVLYRLAGFSCIMIAQFIAYLLHFKNPQKYDLKKLRIHFSLQLIACLYTLSFISKLSYSGILWFAQTDGFSNHVLKSWLYSFATIGNEQILDKGFLFYNFIQNHPVIVAMGLGIAMLIEGLSFLTIFNSKTALFWGIALTGMHIGVYVLMNITILPIILPMLLFMLNLPAILTTIFSLVKNKNNSL